MIFDDFEGADRILPPTIARNAFERVRLVGLTNREPEGLYGYTCEELHSQEMNRLRISETSDFCSIMTFVQWHACLKEMFV